MPRPLRTFGTLIDLIGHTRTTTGLRVKAKLDKRCYPTAVTVSAAAMGDLALHQDAFHGDWNYELRPRTTRSLNWDQALRQANGPHCNAAE